MSLSHFKLLEMEPTKDISKIKSQYRKLAKKYHPDKNKSEGAKEHFQKITEAYNYVLTHIEEETFISVKSSPDIFNTNFMNQNHNDNFEVKLDDIHIDLNITVKEAINGLEKTFKFVYDEVCSSCDGKGGEAIDCEACNGTGYINKQQGFMIVKETCKKCRGTGFKITKTCPVCKGKIIKKKDDEVKIKLDRVPADGTTIKFTGKGNLFKDNRSDLYVHLKIIPENNIRVKKSNIIINEKISILDILKKDKIELKLFDEVIDKFPSELILSDPRVELEGKGLSEKGNLVFEFELFKPYLSKEGKEILKSLK